MQASLPVEPADRNIKAVDIADSGEVAKIVEAAAQTELRARLQVPAPSANALAPAIESEVRGIAVLLLGICRRLAFRHAMMRLSDDGVGRAERDHHDRRSRNRSHAIR